MWQHLAEWTVTCRMSCLCQFSRSESEGWRVKPAERKGHSTEGSRSGSLGEGQVEPAKLLRKVKTKDPYCCSGHRCNLLKLRTNKKSWSEKREDNEDNISVSWQLGWGVSGSLSQSLTKDGLATENPGRVIEMLRSWGPMCPLNLDPKVPPLRENPHCLSFLVLRHFGSASPHPKPWTCQNLENEASVQGEVRPALSYPTFHDYKWFCKLNRVLYISLTVIVQQLYNRRRWRSERCSECSINVHSELQMWIRMPLAA